jgi:hypothetical protein
MEFKMDIYKKILVSAAFSSLCLGLCEIEAMIRKNGATESETSTTPNMLSVPTNIIKDDENTFSLLGNNWETTVTHQMSEMKKKKEEPCAKCEKVNAELFSLNDRRAKLNVERESLETKKYKLNIKNEQLDLEAAKLLIKERELVLERTALDIEASKNNEKRIRIGVDRRELELEYMVHNSNVDEWQKKNYAVEKERCALCKENTTLSPKRQKMLASDSNNNNYNNNYDNNNYNIIDETLMCSPITKVYITDDQKKEKDDENTFSPAENNSGKTIMSKIVELEKRKEELNQQLNSRRAKCEQVNEKLSLFDESENSTEYEALVAEKTELSKEISILELRNATLLSELNELNLKETLVLQSLGQEILAKNNYSFVNNNYDNNNNSWAGGDF